VGRLTALVAAVVLVLSLAWWAQQRRLDQALVRTEPALLIEDPALLRRALAIGGRQFEEHCAICHGPRLQGDPQRGVPDLAANFWLYSDDPVEVERTILYGIRSGHPKARNLTDMPAMVRSGQITRGEARDVVEYLQSLAGNPHDAAAAQRGHEIYGNKGNCFDCHAGDARGVTDYGAPPLTGPRYLYGGDRETLYWSIQDGRHGECPAWIRVLTPVQIRALAIYLVTMARRPAGTQPGA
jgi:cytochrome c oxidase cbb3-type subunit 3